MSELSIEQAKAVECYSTLGATETEEAIAKAVGVTRETLYRWRQDGEGFCKAVRKAVRRNLVREYGPILTALVAKAKKGDVAAARLVMEFDAVLVKKYEIDAKPPLEEGGYAKIVQRGMELAAKIKQEDFDALAEGSSDAPHCDEGPPLDGGM